MDEEFKDRVVRGGELLDADFIPRGLYMTKIVDGVEYRFEPVAPGWFSYAGQASVAGLEAAADD